MLSFFFWVGLLLVVYIYAGYPLLIAWLATNKKNINSDDSYQPMVSILIAAYNEEDSIESTLINKSQLNYPREKIEILVVSDESIDATDSIVNRLADQSDIPIRLVRQVPRAGKTSGLNMIVPEAKGDIIAFSDANSLWEKDALSSLVSNFADQEIGYVTGKMLYTNADGSLIGDGCSAYMKFENWLRGKETESGSIVGVDGGIDAMRKELYEPLMSDQLPDFVQPLKVVEKGYRVIYEPRAILKEEALSDSDSEYRMRVRVSLRAFWAMSDMRELFNPFKFGQFSFQLLSHKLLRYLAFVPLAFILMANCFLLSSGPVYVVIFVAQWLCYLLAFVGHKGKLDNAGVLKIPYYFSLLNVASAQACWRFLRGQKQVLWTPRVG